MTMTAIADLIRFHESGGHEGSATDETLAAAHIELTMAGRDAFAFGASTYPGLAKLAEEMGETQQEIGKLMMTGGDPTHWSGDLHERLRDEIADVHAAIWFVETYCFNDDDLSLMAQRAYKKFTKFEEWHRHPEDDRP